MRAEFPPQADQIHMGFSSASHRNSFNFNELHFNRQMARHVPCTLGNAHFERALCREFP